MLIAIENIVSINDATVCIFSDANTDVCRIIASMFRIFVEEVLGYQTKLLVMDEKNLTFDLSPQFSRLSTCRDPL